MASYSNAISQTGINTEVAYLNLGVDSILYTVSSSNGYAIVYIPYVLSSQAGSTAGATFYIEKLISTGSTWYQTCTSWTSIANVGAGPTSGYYRHEVTYSNAASEQIHLESGRATGLYYAGSGSTQNVMGTILYPGERLRGSLAIPAFTDGIFGVNGIEFSPSA